MIGRPPVVYLDSPIVLHGIEVRLTKEGLKYMIDHWETVLAIATPQQMSNDVRQHIEKTIANYKIHLELYERNQQPETSNQQ